MRKLKEEEATVSAAASEDKVSSSVATTADIQVEVNAVEQRLMEKMQENDMVLTESFLYDGNIAEDQSTEGGSIVSTILTAVAAVVFLIVFSQVPIGQEDLSKYSVAPTSTSRTIDLGDLNTDVSRP